MKVFRPKQQLGAWSQESLDELTKTMCNGHHGKVVYLAGPLGAGKTVMLTDAISQCTNTLCIDLNGPEGQASASDDDEYVELIIDAVGYSPSLIGLYELRRRVGVAAALCHRRHRRRRHRKAAKPRDH